MSPRRVCAWCQEEQPGGGDEAGEEVGLVTHTICPKCEGDLEDFSPTLARVLKMQPAPKEGAAVTLFGYPVVQGQEEPVGELRVGTWKMVDGVLLPVDPDP